MLRARASIDHQKKSPAKCFTVERRKVDGVSQYRVVA
jgi:hypothetical protein